MQNKLFIFKLKSLKHPNIKWDNVSHFLYTNEDRELTKKEKPNLAKTNWYQKYVECNGCIFNYIHDNQLYKVQSYTQELHDQAVNGYFIPHQEKGIWEYTELFSTEISPKFAQALRKTEKYFSMLLAKYGIEGKKKVKDDNNN